MKGMSTLEPNNNLTTKTVEDLFIKNMHLIFSQLPMPICFCDSKCRIVTFNQSFANYYGIELGKVKGKLAIDVDPNARLPVILKTGNAELGKKHNYRGKEIIVDRIPLFFNNELIGGISVTIANDLDFIYKLIIENNLIKDLKLYEDKNQDISEVYKAKYTWEDILSNSQCLNDCKEQAKVFAKTDFVVLITGESGVGKELFAHAIHNHSKRKDYPFIKVNCAAIPENLIEAELLGYVDGAFSGAAKNGRIGKFELANKGTIFLDEIGELPLKMQVKLLRLLEEKELERVGSNKIVDLDVRIIAATNCHLQEKVNNGTFRTDLFYRINVLDLEIPSLKQRKSDIPTLIENFVSKFNKKHGVHREFPDYIIKELCVYDWPGNVRELKNVIVRTMVLSKGDIVKAECITKHILDTNMNAIIKNNPKSLKTSISEIEKNIIINMLTNNNFNKSKTAQALGMPRMTLYRKLKEITKDAGLIEKT